MKYRSIKEENFDKIYHSYAEKLYRICVYLTGDKKLGQEIAEKTLVEFYDCFEDMVPDSWYPYLVFMAKNKVYNLQGD